MMTIKLPISLLLASLLIFSCKPKQTQNLEQMASLSAHAEAVMVKTVKAE